MPCEIRRAVGKIASLARSWLSQGCKDESSGLRGSLSAIGKAASHVRLFLGTRACAEQMRSLFSNKRGAKKTAVCNTGANRSTFEEVTDAVPRGLEIVVPVLLRGNARHKKTVQKYRTCAAFLSFGTSFRNYSVLCFLASPHTSLHIFSPYPLRSVDQRP